MLYENYSRKLQHFYRDYKYSMYWKKSKTYDYLIKKNRIYGKILEKNLGTRDSKTEKIYSDFMRYKKQLEKDLKEQYSHLKQNIKYNKSIKLGRVPNELVDIYKKINQYALDDKLVLIGTNALYAYEAQSGVYIDEQHLATDDIDILAKANKVSVMPMEVFGEKTMIEIIKEIDKSFEINPKVPYQFVNKNNTILEIINPTFRDMIKKHENGGFLDEIISLDMNGMGWIENSQPFESLVVGLNGEVAKVVTINPVDFAVYKNWLGQKSDRSPIKRSRDILQSKIATELVLKYMTHIDISSRLEKMLHFKSHVVDRYRESIYKEACKRAELDSVQSDGVDFLLPRK